MLQGASAIDLDSLKESPTIIENHQYACGESVTNRQAVRG
jgi:hypothetical protein